MNADRYRLLLIALSVVTGTAALADSDKVHFDTPKFDAYEATYNSTSSVTGEFTLQVRPVPGEQAINLIDIIPTPSGTIVAQRNVDANTHRLQNSAGPYFAWGAEYITQNYATDKRYDWVRIPLAGGAPVHIEGGLEHGAPVSVMFSPALAAAMPMTVDSTFSLPATVPVQAGHVESSLVSYKVLRREALKTPAGIACECWVLEQQGQGASVTHYWVDRKAPFVFRRHRDVGGEREFVSDLQSYRKIAR